MTSRPPGYQAVPVSFVSHELDPPRNEGLSESCRSQARGALELLIFFIVCLALSSSDSGSFFFLCVMGVMVLGAVQARQQQARAALYEDGMLSHDIEHGPPSPGSEEANRRAILRIVEQLGYLRQGDVLLPHMFVRASEAAEAERPPITEADLELLSAWTRDPLEAPDQQRKCTGQAPEPGSPSGEPACSVCLEDLRGDQRVTQLGGCSHSFHETCILQWLRQQGHGSECPQCRARVFPDCDDEEDAVSVGASDSSGPGV